MKNFLEVGKIVNTHGIRGELKVIHYCDSAEFLCEFDTLYLDEKTSLKVTKNRIHKNNVLITVDGISDINDAEKYKGKMLYINRDDVEIDENQVFQQDIIGMNVYDEYVGDNIGVVKDILQMPTYDMFVIKGNQGKEHLVPDVDAFIVEIDVEKNLMTIKTIEGMIYEN